MNSDDLGQFPKPVSPQTPVEPTTPPVPYAPEPIAPVNDAPLYNDPFAKPAANPIVPEETTSEPTTPDTFSQAPSFDDSTITEPETTTPDTHEITTFEETPDEIPSVQPAFTNPSETFSTPEYTAPAETPPIVETAPIAPEIATPVYEPAPEITAPFQAPSVPATPPVAPPSMVAATVPHTSSSIAPVIFIVLLLVAGIGLAASVFLFSQSAQLKKQLTDITQTLEKQKTTVTPTPTETPIEVATPSLTPTPEASVSAFLTPTSTPTPTPINSATPLFYAKQALKVAINKQPNAQMILIKVENATDPVNSVTKYFFRQDLTTKKYFYVTILGTGEPAVIDKAIYVTPDNNIPSLNEAVSSESFGVDLDKALKISYDTCKSGLCETANLKAQFIKSNENYIWQLAFTPKDTTKDNLVIQINSLTKEILYKSSGF